MFVKKLHIKDLRNHSDTSIDLSEGINHFYGLNGSGKTTILEALSILSLSKTFLPSSDSDLVKYGADTYSINLQATSDLNSIYKCNIIYKKGERKKIKNSIKDNVLPKDLIGQMPIIILSPDFKNITFGAPSDRREFLDKVISQSSKSYIKDQLDLKKVLKQRNSLLNRFKKEGIFSATELLPWTQKLIDLTIHIIEKRNDFLKELKPIFEGVYRKISDDQDKVEISYKPYGIDVINEDLGEKVEYLADQKLELEKIRGTSLFGPQKDDIEFTINQGIARENASQGQHKSILIALKIAEFYYLKEKCRETPIILLDDIFSELDKKRSKQVLDLVKDNKVQTFITSTEKDILDDSDIEVKYFELSAGQVV